MMQNHLEFVKVIPTSSFILIQIVIKIPSRESKAVKLLRRRQKQNGRRFLIAESRIITCNSMMSQS